MTDSEVLPNLLKQTREEINEISADGAYDTGQRYETVRIKRAVSLISPRKEQFFENEFTRVI
ncbi:Transposase [Candidatus Enterovibrio altilux]|uniref:Transposase n=1 Tax=Candidatus Enterovibrio altilux TaxID=1927128 RepID=A0A291B6L1_9GAMM|nr:Transposase [Candidatus Enterovibrio luxaltus]